MRTRSLIRPTTHGCREVSTVVLSVTLLVLAVLAMASCADLVGTPPGPGGRNILLYDAAGPVPPASLRPIVDKIIVDAASRGACLDVYVLPGGSAAAMTTVTFTGDIAGGNLQPSGRNKAAWSKSTAAKQAAAIKQTHAAITKNPATGNGDDLLGATQTAITAAAHATCNGPARVDVVTGGGAHRTGDLDLAGLTPSNAAALATKQISPPPSVHVTLHGIGAFPGVEPPISSSFASALTVFWTATCPTCELR